ncbi:MAG: AMP-binding protein [Oscillospiraceae bacterium]|jgi:acetyl-CoA synthetase|nr:AMP-binding protein [Oscillospiraceae bacterium]
MGLLERFLPRIEFDSYEDFIENYRLNVPERFNFGFDVVDAWAELEPSKKALVWCDDNGGEEVFTFADIAEKSGQAANWFAAQGIQKGDAVLLILRRRWEYWVCAVALHKLGAVVVPASLQLTSKDIAYRLEAARIKLLVCVADEGLLKQADEANTPVKRAVVAGEREGWLPFDIGGYPSSFPRPMGEGAVGNGDTMLVYFSSGTTGMPKMVRHTFIHPLGQIVTAKYWQRVREDKLHMSVSDSGWAKFGWGKIYGQWICGACIFAYDMEKFVPKNLLQKMQDYRLTTFCAPPTMYRFMLQEDIASYDLSSIERYCNAGEPLNPEVFERMRALTGRELAEGFGQSESSVLIATFPWLAAKPGSMGKPSPLYDIDLVNEEGESCETGEEGEIVVRGLQNPSGLFTEYLGDAEANAKAFRNGCYYTGDVAWRDDDGYYWFVGRNDDVIKCSGYRIGPFEVESALIQHESVLECAVTAAPDPVRGQVVKATVVLKRGFSPSDKLAKELQEHVKRVTAPYKYPRIVVFSEELPKTASGKIKRAEIRKITEQNS